MDDQWIDKDAALISPDAKFRHDLAQALQDSHERQRVQRQLYGSAPSAQRGGQAIFWRLLGALGLLPVTWAQDRIRARLGVRGRVLICPHAEAGMDVDRPDHFAVVTQALSAAY